MRALGFILAVAVIVGLAWLFLRRRASTSVPIGGNQHVPPVVGGPTTVQAKPMTGILAPVLKFPGLAQSYAVAKPVSQYVVEPAVHRVNSILGGGTASDPLTRNPDGSYTDGLGARLTLGSNGTITRHNPPWNQTNGGKVIAAAGRGIATGAKAVAHAGSSTLHAIESIF